jgi:uncharacterized delta-60 repeat protein
MASNVLRLFLSSLFTVIDAGARLRAWRVAVLFCAIPPCVGAQYGALDATWGGVGYVKTSILSPSTTSATDSARAIAVQLDGKVVAAGVCYNGSAYSLCLARYNANGSLDTSFGTSGKTTIAITGNNATYQATAVALTPTGGTLVITGCTDASNVRQFCAARFDASGVIDTGFGVSGVVTTSLTTTNNYPASIGYQSDGRVLLGGLCGNQICAAAYLQDGSAIDTSFGNNGLLLNPLTGTFNRETYVMEIDPSNRVLLAGSCIVAAQPVFCVSRFSPSGQSDNTFGSNGVAAFDALPGNADYAYAMAVQEDGKIILTGQAFNTIGSGSSLFDFATVRYNANGTLDTSFGSSGSVVTRVATGYSEARAVIVQADGKIVVAGHCYDSPGSLRRFCLAAYTASGALDTSFNASGVIKSALVGVRDEAYSMAIGRDGKLYVAGFCRYASGSSQYDFCVARYHGSPTGGLPCNVDLDGSGTVLALSDSLLHARTTQQRYKNPFAGFIMVSGLGVPFFVDAWTPIYKKLLRTSTDYDGDGAEDATDSMIHARVALGFTGSSVTDGITFAPTATRSTWSTLRTYLVNLCAMTLP